jgi:hypothetical protein
VVGHFILTRVCWPSSSNKNKARALTREIQLIPDCLVYNKKTPERSLSLENLGILTQREVKWLPALVLLT